MPYKVSADFGVMQMSETFTFLFYALKAVRYAVKHGAKVTIEKEKV